jgi:hypothetical protein
MVGKCHSLMLIDVGLHSSMISGVRLLHSEVEPKSEICHQRGKLLELKVSNKGHESRPRADYCLKPDERKEIFKWLKNMKFLDRYAANLKRAVNLKTGKLIGLKSHDYHIIMERLMLVMF